MKKKKRITSVCHFIQLCTLRDPEVMLPILGRYQSRAKQTNKDV